MRAPVRSGGCGVLCMDGWIMEWDTRSNCSRVVPGIIVCEFIVYSFGGIYFVFD
jgi:hypothetical protein